MKPTVLAIIFFFFIAKSAGLSPTKRQHKWQLSNALISTGAWLFRLSSILSSDHVSLIRKRLDAPDYFSAHFTHMAVITPATIAPDAMNIASFCQKSKAPAKKAR